MQGGLADAAALWEKFRQHFCDDLKKKTFRRQKYDPPFIDLKDPQTDLGLFLLNQLLQDFRHFLQNFGLPVYQHEWQQQENNRLIASELD